MIDIARRANIALSTVSYALNGTRQISEKTKQRIFTTMDELGYKPHALARVLGLCICLWINPYIAQRSAMFAEGVTLQMYQLQDGKRVSLEIPTISGETDATFTIQREKGMVTVERKGAPKAWKVRLMGVGSVGKAEGAAVEISPQGALLTPAAGAERVKIAIE